MGEHAPHLCWPVACQLEATPLIPGDMALAVLQSLGKEPLPGSGLRPGSGRLRDKVVVKQILPPCGAHAEDPTPAESQSPALLLFPSTHSTSPQPHLPQDFLTWRCPPKPCTSRMFPISSTSPVVLNGPHLTVLGPFSPFGPKENPGVSPPSPPLSPFFNRSAATWGLGI